MRTEIVAGRERVIRIRAVLRRMASVGLISRFDRTNCVVGGEHAVLPKEPAPQGYMAYSPLTPVASP